MYHCLAEFEEQRVSLIDGHIHLTAQDHVLLCIILINAVDERGAPKGIARVQGNPEAIVERIADVSFQSGQWLLPQDLMSMASGVVCVEVPIRVRIELPLLFRPEGMRQRDFGLERPAI